MVEGGSIPAKTTMAPALGFLTLFMRVGMSRGWSVRRTDIPSASVCWGYWCGGSVCSEDMMGDLEKI